MSLKTIYCGRGQHQAEVPDTWKHNWCQRCVKLYKTTRKFETSKGVRRVTPVDGSNMTLAYKLIEWMKDHGERAAQLNSSNSDYKVFTIVASLPAPTGKSDVHCIDIVFEVVGLNYERAIKLSPFKFAVVFAGEGRCKPVRGWTLEEYEDQYDKGFAYEDMEQRTYEDPSNGKPDAVKGKKR